MMLTDRVYSPNHFDTLFVIFGQVFKLLLNLQVLNIFCLFFYFPENPPETFFTQGLASPCH